jgi:PleD family two-component response regulator
MCANALSTRLAARCRKDFERRYQDRLFEVFRTELTAVPGAGPSEMLSAVDQEAAPHMVADIRVLIVDDEVYVAELLTEIVESFGYTAHMFTNGTQALRAVPEFRPKVVLLDVRCRISAGRLSSNVCELPARPRP